MPYRPIDPREKLDYSNDWSDELDDVGSPSDTINSSTWSIEGGGSPSPTVTPQPTVGVVTSAFVEGCQPGEEYRLYNQITTGQSRTLGREFVLRCDKR